MDLMLGAIETRLCHCIISIRAFLKFIKKWDKFEKILRTENGYDCHYYTIEDEIDTIDLMFRISIIPVKSLRQMPYISTLFIKKLVRMYFYFNTLMKCYYKSIIEGVVDGEPIFNYEHDFVYKFHKNMNPKNLIAIKKSNPFEITAPLTSGLRDYINAVFKIDYNVMFKPHFNNAEIAISRNFMTIIKYAHKSAICFAEAYESFDAFCFATGELNIARPFEFGFEIDKEEVMRKLESIRAVFDADKSTSLNDLLVGADNALMNTDEIQGRAKLSEFQPIDVCIMLMEHKVRAPWY